MSIADIALKLGQAWGGWEIEVFNQEGCQETYDAVCMISRVNATAPSKDYANRLSLRSLSHSLLADHPLD